MGDTAEREVKLGAGAGFALPDLAELEAVVVGGRAERLPEQRLEAVYYDTPDLSLARWGVTVRHRSGDGTGWTVKLPGDGAGNSSMLVRRELTFGGTRRSVPAEVARLVMAFVRRASFAPVASLRTRRTGVQLFDDQGRPVAEVVDDEVSVLEGRRVAARFREVEVEAGEWARDGAIGAVVDRLRAAGAGAPDTTPKVVRALGPRALLPPELVPVELPRDALAHEALRAALTGSVIRVLRHDPGARLGDDPEDVHQARVGTRRLRSDLRTFRSLLDEEWVGSLRDELRWLAGLFGPVRDADVLLERLGRNAKDLPDQDAPGARALLRRLAQERDAARAELLAGMATDRYVDLLDRLVAAARAPLVQPESDGAAREVLPALVQRPWRHLRRAVEALPDDPPAEALHEVRIRAKRCRYAAEAAVPVVGRPARAFASAVAGLQQVLGDHQDAIVAEEWLRRAGARSGARAALVAGELVAVQRAEAAARRAEWAGAWQRASRKKLRSWLP